MAISKIFTTGRLSADPELNTVSDTACCTFTVCSDTRTKDAEGNYITNFFRVTAWRGLGENCAKYLHKGDKVTVVGDFVDRKYKDKNGVERSSLQVTASDVEFPSKKESADAAVRAATVVNEQLPF